MVKSSFITGVAAAVLLTACGDNHQAANSQSEQVQQAAAESDALTNYKVGAEELVAMIKAAKPDAQIVAKSASLVAESKQIIAQFMEKHPNCTTYLTALNQAADIIPTLPLEEIESGYHADGKLPNFEDPNCYHAKDLLVHPATVQAMATMGIKDDAMRESAEHEIIEVIAHFSQVESALK